MRLFKRNGMKRKGWREILSFSKITFFKKYSLF